MPDPSKKPVKKKPSAPAKPGAPASSEAAYQTVSAEMAALDPTAFVPINLDIPQAVSQALGVIPNLAELRAQIVKELPHHPIAGFDKLQTYALAVYHAHILSLPPETTASRVASLLAEAAPLRANLLSDAEALARRGLLNADTVAQIRAGQGNVDLANDLVALSALLNSEWAAIAQKTAATAEEVQRAAELGPLLLAALGVRNLGNDVTPSVAAEQRRRAFTLFVRAYDEVRRALVYLRWHEGDVDHIMPSLYKGRSARPKEEASAAPEAKPADAKPAEAKPADAKPADAKPVDAKPADAKPADAKPADAKPA